MYCLPEMSYPGGIARVTALKANWLAQHGNDVMIVTTDQRGEKVFYDLYHSVKHIDLDIDFRSYEQDNLLKKFLCRRMKIKRCEKELHRIQNEWKADIIVSTFNNESEFLYKWDDGSRKVLEFHFCYAKNEEIIKYGNVSFQQGVMLKLKDCQLRKLAKKYDAFVVLTHEDAEAWKGYENLHVIPNMLSFSSGKVSLCNTKEVIAVGRLDFQKKFDRLIEIWDLVCQKNKDWHLSIYGKGPDKEVLQKTIEGRGLKDRVDIYEPTPIIKEKYLSSSIYVMTSTYEGLPMTLLEAISMGLPCVAYNFPCGPRDIIEEGRNGYLVEKGDKQIFAMRLAELMNNEELRQTMSRNAVETSKKYNVDRVMEQWKTLFTGLLNK